MFNTNISTRVISNIKCFFLPCTIASSSSRRLGGIGEDSRVVTSRQKRRPFNVEGSTIRRDHVVKRIIPFRSPRRNIL